MLWLLAQLVIISLPQAYPVTLETLNWCAPALGIVLVSLAVLWMVCLRHFITGPETGESHVPIWLEPKPSRWWLAKGYPNWPPPGLADVLHTSTCKCTFCCCRVHQQRPSEVMVRLRCGVPGLPPAKLLDFASAAGT